MTPGIKGKPVQVQVLAHGRWKTVMVVKAGTPNSVGESNIQFTLHVPSTARKLFHVRLLTAATRGCQAGKQPLGFVVVVP